MAEVKGFGQKSPFCRRLRPAWFPLFLATVVAAHGLGQTAETPLEYQVKAAFLLNFTKFVEWPAAAFDDTKSPLAICVLGEDPFGGALDQLVAGETANDRKLAVKRLRKAPEAKACQVLFVSPSEHGLPALLAAVGPGVLTVGEGDQFLREGGIVAFVVSDRHVRFDINQTAALRAQLSISARLLSVARSVQR